MIRPCSILAVLTCSLDVSGGVVLHMPPPPSRPASAAAVTPLQRFAVGEPAKDRAGRVILQQVTSSPRVGNGWGGYGRGGYGWGGYGWGGYGWGWGGWGPMVVVDCCHPCRPVRPVCDSRPRGMVFGSGLMAAW
ncbi:MAG: hypothetical protein QF733_07855 [Phycisphaerales bacterium]|nr:hypothetical protein [Phycisphaerales bacterium]